MTALIILLVIVAAPFALTLLVAAGVIADTNRLQDAEDDVLKDV